MLCNIINYLKKDEIIILAAILVYKYFNTLEIFYSSRNCIKIKTKKKSGDQGFFSNISHFREEDNNYFRDSTTDASEKLIFTDF